MMALAVDYSIYARTLRHPSGLRMCARKHDKPTGSYHSKKHIDRECCLDKNEIPNPFCFYGSKYNKLLGRL